MDYWRINMANDNFDKLIQTHGKRTKPDDFMQRRAMNNVKAHWQETLIKKRKQRNFRIVGIAASLFVVVGMVVLMNSNLTINKVQFSNDQYVQGQLMVSTDGKNWQTNQGKSLSSAKWIKTSTDSYASLTLTDNSQLRVNQNSIIKVIDPLVIELVEGELYIDADDSIENSPLLIQTTQGNVKHIGTRYLVKSVNKKLELAVRNGLIELNNNDLKQQLQAGKKLNMTNKGDINISKIGKDEQLWKWTLLAAEPFAPKNKSLNEFIEWYAHENDLKINWNNNEAKTKRVKLSGELSNLNQSQQLKAVFLSTKFDYKINQGILSIL